MAITPTGDSILAVDFGSTTTRAALIDVVDGVYHFVAVGQAPTTSEPPFANISEGLGHALENLRQITGRQFFEEGERLIMPSRADGAGVDSFYATASAGRPLKTVVLGLLPEMSVASARRLASANYVHVVEVISLGDRRREEQQVDAILKAKPDLLVLAGGTDGGAHDAVLRLAETAAVAFQLMDAEHRPRVLFIGNNALRNDVERTLSSYAKVWTALNVLPSLDLEQIDSALHELSSLYQAHRIAAVAGYGEIAQWSSSGITPTARAFGRVIRYLSKLYTSGKGALGVDVGSANTTVAAAWGGEGPTGRLCLNVYSELGVGYNAHNVLDHTPLDKITRWLPTEMPERRAREYVLNKTLYPNTIPQDADELHLEHAMARQVLREALKYAYAHWPPNARRPRADLLPWFEPILGAGAVLTGAPHPGHAALILLDAIQPTGISTLLLDANAIAPALGAAAPTNPLATVQVIDSGGFMRLGPVIAPVGLARPGQTVLRLKVTPEAGETINTDVAFGTLQVLPLDLGQTANVTVQPLRGFNVGRGPGRTAILRGLEGGVLGLIIDARGRPLRLPQKAVKRQEAVQKWIWELGG